MSELPLDLMYRPRRLCEVVGNAGVVKLLLKRSAGGTLAGRSMLFGGPKGCGKTSLARIVAMAIGCESLKAGEPCGACDPCKSVVADTSANMDEFDAATQGTVDRVRSIIEDLEYGSFDGKPRVVILDEAQRLSKAAQDALLKAVEDRRFVIVMCTTEPHKIGEAIRSRLEEYPVSAPTESEVVARMVHVCDGRGIPYEPEALALVARHNKCCPRTCLTSLDTLRTLGGATGQTARELFRYASMELLADAMARVDSDPAAAFDTLDRLFSQEGPTWVRDNMVAAISSALRVHVGARPTYPVRCDFFPSRGMRWGDLARALGALDRPYAHDVEAAVLATGRAAAGAPMPDAPPPPPRAPDPPPPAPVLAAPAPALPPPSPAPSPAPADPAPVQTPKAPAAPPKLAVVPSKRSLEIDGVKFTHDERLTSLDDKIEPGGQPPPAVLPPSADVELDKSRIPLPEKEFARGLVQRIQKAD